MACHHQSIESIYNFGMSYIKPPPVTAKFPSLANQFLLSMPHMNDPNFSGSLIYICEHSEKGAMGLIVNKSSDVSLGALFERIQLSLTIGPRAYLPVMGGGPVQCERGFVLHSPGQEWASSLQISDTLALTTSRDVLEAIASGGGPERWLIALGYSGWGAAQLEREIARNDWLTIPANDTLLFETPLNKRFELAYKQLGVNPLLLTSIAGHA